MKAYKIHVRGKVQGVFYRHTAQQQAKQLGIAGFASNESDGSVYMEAEGEETALKHFIDWTRSGSPTAQVENVEVEEQEPQNHSDFEIR